jgi:hypothetical protein
MPRSPLSTALIVSAALAAIVLPVGGYAALYLWRLELANVTAVLDEHSSRARLRLEPQFASPFEDVVFFPAVLVDRAVRPQVWDPPEYFDQAPIEAR